MVGDSTGCHNRGKDLVTQEPDLSQTFQTESPVIDDAITYSRKARSCVVGRSAPNLARDECVSKWRSRTALRLVADVEKIIPDALDAFDG